MVNDPVSQKEKIDNLLGSFDAKKNAAQFFAPLGKQTFVLDDAFIDKAIKEIQADHPDFISDDDLVALKKRINSVYEVHQEDGDALLSNYNHVDWYPRAGEERPYWDRYKAYLVKINPFMKGTIETFNRNTDKITNYFGDPKAEGIFQVRGLVMGDVQSGKTSTYIGTICKAVDAGYKVVILLTGMVESLRKQTQTRIDEGYVGYDSVSNKRVGVGIGSALDLPRSLTSTASDYTGSNIDKNTDMSIRPGDPVPLILVCKKNTNVLGKIIRGMKNLNISSNHKLIDAPLLLIDDEADNASINTYKPDLDPTKINDEIRNLLKLFKKATYVGFTATPFANVFIQPDNTQDMLADNLFPQDFIFSLKAPTDYVGPMSLFFDSGNYHNCLVNIDDYIGNESLFSYSHKKDWDGDRLFPSFYDAIITFCLANAIRDLRGDINAHRSMLINISRFKDVQAKIKVITADYLGEIQKAVRLFGRQKDVFALANPMMRKIHEVWQKQYENHCEYSWDKVKAALYDAISPIDIEVINSNSKGHLDYAAHKVHGWRVIAIGGLALSRGLTLEGLVVSYFFRNTSTYDVLMQMGRWFGYRHSYGDLVRIWISQTSARWYGEVAEAIDVLRKDIDRMVDLKKTPKEFGIRVRADSEELGITASNKMRNAVDRIDRDNGSFYGGISETVYLSEDLNDHIHNWDCVKKLCQHLGTPDPKVNQPYFRGVPKAFILELINNVHIPQGSSQFDQPQLSKFVETSDDPNLNAWDVLFASKQKGEDEWPLLPVQLPHGVCPNAIVRTCAVTNGGYLLVSGSAAHIGSRDTKTGLDPQKIKEIEAGRPPEKGTNQTMYLYEGRAPLLIVYCIEPNVEACEPHEREIFMQIRTIPEATYPAFSFGFPANSKVTGSSTLFKVNRSASYYDNEGFKTEPKKEDEDL